MTILINPGSGPVADSGNGWTNTYETARELAVGWLKRMHHDEGMRDVELLEGHGTRDGRWVFTFRHSVTNVEIELETHGVDHIDAYQAERVFAPRVYWNGSSSANPELEHFAARGFESVRTFRPVDAS